MSNNVFGAISNKSRHFLLVSCDELALAARSSAVIAPPASRVFAPRPAHYGPEIRRELKAGGPDMCYGSPGSQTACHYPHQMSGPRNKIYLRAGGALCWRGSPTNHPVPDRAAGALRPARPGLQLPGKNGRERVIVVCSVTSYGRILTPCGFMDYYRDDLRP